MVSVIPVRSRVIAISAIVMAIMKYAAFCHRKMGHRPAFWFQTDLQSSPPYRADVVGAESTSSNISSRKAALSNNNIHWGTGTKCYEHAGHELKFPNWRNVNIHTYGLLWTPKAYVFYIDGKPIWRTSRGISNFELYINLTEDMEPRKLWALFLTIIALGRSFYHRLFSACMISKTPASTIRQKR
jgi:hypothetical protein